MSKQKAQNPLFEVQREKAGSTTYNKYAYQYHWALFRILTEHEDLKEYAVFVELHEDVVLATSLDATDALFEFNQVKTSKHKFNTHQLTVLKKGKSVLGKLVDSSLKKSFTSKIKYLNLVALNDFSLELKKKGATLQKITIDDLSQNQVKDLEGAIMKELAGEKLPINLQFIVPELSEKNYQNDIIATIARLISKIMPGSYSNPVEIYRILIDELNRKGVLTYDFSKWEEVLSKKALTSTTVTRVINEFSNIKDEAKVESEFSNFCSELGLKTIPTKMLKKSFTRYRNTRISNTSTLQMDTTNTIQTLIDKKISEGISDAKELVDIVSSELSDKVKSQFATENDLHSAIICEYIMMN